MSNHALRNVGAILKKHDELDVADNTIVIYSTDNGNEFLFYPNGGVIIGESTTQLAGLMLPPGREWQAQYK